MDGASVKVAVDHPHYRITYDEGAAGLVVVAFAGIGLKLGGIPTEEFRSSLKTGAEGGGLSIVYVMDLRRRWYNDGTLAPLSDHLNALLARLGARDVVTLGNSMGGFGAVVFAKRLAGCTKAIAFCPQSSVSPDVKPFETRWRNWRSQIEIWDVKDAVAELSDDVSYDLFYGADDRDDRRHAKRFRAAGARDLRVHMIEGCRHDVAKHLRSQDKLKPMLFSLIAPLGGDAGPARPASPGPQPALD